MNTRKLVATGITLVSLLGSLGAVVACGSAGNDAAAPAPVAGQAKADSLQAWLSQSPRSAEITYVYDNQNTWTGQTVLVTGKVAVPISFTFYSEKLDAKALAAFKSGASPVSVEFNPADLRFMRSNGLADTEEVDLKTLSDYVGSSALLATLCGDKVAMSSHATGMFNGVSGDFTLQVHQPREIVAGQSAQHGIAAGTDPGCEWVSSYGGFVKTCQSGNACFKQIDCIITIWTWVSAGGSVGGTYTDGGSYTVDGSASGSYQATTINSPIPIAGGCFYNGGVIYDTCICQTTPASVAAAVAACTARQQQTQNPPPNPPGR